MSYIKHKKIYEIFWIFDMEVPGIQGVSKKMSFSGKTAITTFKLIQNAKVGSVLENLEYLLQCGH